MASIQEYFAGSGLVQNCVHGGRVVLVMDKYHTLVYLWKERITYVFFYKLSGTLQVGEYSKDSTDVF